MTANEITALANIAAELLKVAESLSALAASEQQVVEVPAPKAPKAVKTESTKAKKHAKKHTQQEWYAAFESTSTEVKVLGSTVQVTVKRGHAPEWHDQLRSAGFTWSRKNHNWWAYLNDEQRAKVAKRNIENDAATAGMDNEQKREYWRARRAARRTA